MLKHNIPNQYYKCPVTGIEMYFKFDRGSGWSVGFPKGHNGLREMKKAGLKIPFPDTPKQYEKEVEEFYRMLEENL